MGNYKPFEQLTLQDDFMFFAVMRNPELCKPMLERILGIKIRKIEYPTPQKVIDIRADSKSVRLDIYVEDDEDTVYNVEMQATKKYDFPKRVRYYQDVIDIDMLEKGQEYNQLKQTYIIFICTFDPFEKGYHKYVFENRCEKDFQLKLNDGTVKIFLNTKGTDDVDEELKNMLEYIETGIPCDEYTYTLEENVEVMRRNRKWRREYMTLQMKYNEIMKDARREGLAAGRAEAVAANQKQFIKQICKKLQKEKDLTQIIDELELDEDEQVIKAKMICEVASGCEYDIQNIYEKVYMSK